MSSTTAPLPKERDPLWERATVGANTKETAESVNAAVLAVTGESGVAGDGRTVGNTLRSGPGALMGLPAEFFLPGHRASAVVAATVECAEAMGLPLLDASLDPDGQLREAAAWALKTYPGGSGGVRAGGGGSGRAPPRAGLDFGDEPAFLAPGLTGEHVILTAGVVLGIDPSGGAPEAVALATKLGAAEPGQAGRLAAMVGVELPHISAEAGTAVEGMEAAAAVAAAAAAASRAAAIGVAAERLRGVLGRERGGRPALVRERPPAPAPLSWAGQLAYSAQAATVSKMVGLLAPAQAPKVFPKLRKALAEKGKLPEAPLLLAALAGAAPSALLALEPVVRAQLVAYFVLVEAVERMHVRADVNRIKAVLSALDGKAAAAVASGALQVELSPLMAALHLVPLAQVALAVLAQPIYHFGQVGGGPAAKLVAAVSVLSFLDSARDLQLGPGAERLAAALVEFDAAPSCYLDVRQIMELVARAVSQALGGGGDYTCVGMPATTDDERRRRHFETWGRSLLRDISELELGEPMLRSDLDAVVAELDVLAQAQAGDRAQLRRASGNHTTAAVEKRIAALHEAMTEAEAEAEAGGGDPEHVGAITMVHCSSTPGCGGTRRSSDVLCLVCSKFLPDVWACPLCKRITLPGMPECFKFDCKGMRPPIERRIPVLALAPGGGPSEAVLATAAAYAKRERLETEARASGRGGGLGGGPGRRS